MNTVLSFLQTHREQLGLQRYVASDQLTCVLLTPKFRASKHVVCIVMSEGNPDPVLVAKVPRLGDGGQGVLREAESLRAIQKARLGGFNSIPRVVAFEEYGGSQLLIETALVGTPMSPAVIRQDPAGCCEALLAWLTEIQCPAPSAAESDRARFERLVTRPLRRFADFFLPSPEDAWLVERTMELVTPLAEVSLPPLFEHGDLSHPNILLLRNGGVGVVDWELAEPSGLPACDLFFFLSYVASAVSKAHTAGTILAAFRQAFFQRGAWARTYVARYAERLGLPAHALTPLFVLCWARYTSNLLARLGGTENRQARVSAGTATWVRASRPYSLWRHAVACSDELDWSDIARGKTRGI